MMCYLEEECTAHSTYFFYLYLSTEFNCELYSFTRHKFVGKELLKVKEAAAFKKLVRCSETTGLRQ